MNRTIFHIDVNSAFLSWEAVYRLVLNPNAVDLRTIPSVIGGDIEKRRGIILAKSIPAKKYDIQTGEPLAKALEKCPTLTVAEPHYDLYENNSQEMINIFLQYTDKVEKYSIDEAFLDVTESVSLYNDPITMANQIKDQIYEELGFTVNIGISSNKLLAKMASDFKKPDMIHTLYPLEIKDKMWHLPVRDLFFVGHATENKLLTLGIKTIGELANMDKNILKDHFKKHGEVIHNNANGIDNSLVETIRQENKGYGNSTTLSKDVSDSETAKQILLSLSETVCSRMRKDNIYATVISIGMKYSDFGYESHQMRLENPSNITEEIGDYASKILNNRWNGKPLRQLGVRATNLTKESARQLNLFDYNHYVQRIKLDATVDEIRCKFGDDSIKRGCFLNTGIQNLAGGIPHERRSPNNR